MANAFRTMILLSGVVPAASLAAQPSDFFSGTMDDLAILEAGFQNAMEPALVSLEPDFSTGVFTLIIRDELMTPGETRRVPLRAVSRSVAESAEAELDMTVRPDGSVAITASGITLTVVPASHDPVSFHAALDTLGEVTLREDGAVLVRDRESPPEFFFSGAFDYQGITRGGFTGGTARLTPPVGTDESDPAFLYQVTYPDGAEQTIQPFVAAEGFIASLEAMGLPVATDRNSGIVTINGMPYRPSYFVELPAPADERLLSTYRDPVGLAYRPTDVNGDGALDYRVISDEGVQVLYGLLD